MNWFLFGFVVVFFNQTWHGESHYYALQLCASLDDFDFDLGHRENRLIGLVVKASASRAEYPGFESRLRWDFSGVESCQ